MKLHNSILKILSNPDIIKIGADVAGDIRSLHALRHFNERGFVDLQQIACRWGIEEKSLRKLSAIVLGQRVSKAQRLSNWEAGKLTPQQQMYAATDAWVCISIYDKLMATEPTTQDVEIKTISVQPTIKPKPTKTSDSTKQETSKNEYRGKPKRRFRHKREDKPSISTKI